MVEILSPAGNYESLMAAIKAGCDAVYFGVEQLNMRARSVNNFKLKDLPKIAKICKKNNVKSCLAVNTIIYDHDIKLMKKICDAAKKSGINAIIASDHAVINYVNEIGMELHLSTQVNVSNIEAVKFYSKFADVIVLARELTLNQVKNIVKEIKKQKITGPKGDLVKIEVFAHGALCVAISGKCYMSLATYNSSANRGACLQNCRRSYTVTDNETGDQLAIENEYIMSPKDLCTINFLDKILDTGVSILKLEGRARAADYVYTVTSCYKEAVQAVKTGSYTEEKIKNWLERLGQVYNRGFWGGYFLGKKLGEWSEAYGSKASKKKIFIGRCKNYYKKAKVAEFLVEAEELKVGDEILITGVTTGVIKSRIKELMSDKGKTEIAKKGEIVTFLLEEQTRPNDKLFILKNDKNNISTR